MLKKLQKSKIAAMKEKDTVAKAILSLLHSDALNMAKKEMREVTDDDIIKSSKSLIKRNKQTIAEVDKVGGDSSALHTEVGILLNFLPPQKTGDEIKAIIDDMINDFPEEERTRRVQGTIMKELKKAHGDSIDMGAAAKYIGTLLS